MESNFRHPIRVITSKELIYIHVDYLLYSTLIKHDLFLNMLGKINID